MFPHHLAGSDGRSQSRFRPENPGFSSRVAGKLFPFPSACHCPRGPFPEASQLLRIRFFAFSPRFPALTRASSSPLERESPPPLPHPKEKHSPRTGKGWIILLRQMETASSGLSLTHSTVPELNKQPVYTTVGSIYNPSKSSAIQAPTRRPRPRRYPTAFPVPAGAEAYTDTLGNTLLTALSLREANYNLSPAPRPRTPQYSPLQQNLDRAASPRLIAERVSARFPEPGMSTPSIRSGNLPPPPSTLGFNIDTIDRQSGAAFGDTDSVASEETLASSRIGVKGLANLASYPNPMQKAAQNKLARARIANLGVQSASTSLHAAVEYGNGGTSGSGTGAPRPLTAGPPGQRHFRPATFDSASRTAKVEDTDIAQRVSTLDHIDVLEALSTLRAEAPSRKPHPTINNRFPVNDYTGSAVTRDNSRPDNHMSYGIREAVLTPQSVVAQPPVPAAAKSDNEARTWSARDGRPWVARDTLPVGDIGKYYPRGLAKDYTAASQQSQQSKGDASDPKLELSRRFYAGTEGLVRNTNRVVHEHDVRCHKNRIGVIGEGRERSRHQRDGSDRVQPEFIDVRDANEMEDSLHAVPLLNMMLETILRYQEGTRPSGTTSPGFPTVFVPADPAWVDDSQGGNKSFFEKRHAEEPTRGNASRRTRRRY